MQPTGVGQPPKRRKRPSGQWLKDLFQRLKTMLADIDIRRYWTRVWFVFLAALAVFFMADNLVIFPLGLGVSFTLYGAWAVAHTVMQFILAGINLLRVNALDALATKTNFFFPYAVLSFGHKESERYYRPHLESIAKIRDRQMQGAIFMADGFSRENSRMFKWFTEVYPPSKGGLALQLPRYFTGVFSEWTTTQQQEILERIQSVPNVKYLFIMQAHGGKRKIMYTAFQIARVLWPNVKGFGVTDSDTKILPEINPDAFFHLSRLFIRNNPLKHHKTIGAVCGYVGIDNVKDSFLTRLSADRYWRAFMLERGAQSATGSVICVSGPLGMYLAEALFEILEDWYKSTFLGAERTYGDDRELTNKILRAGYEVWYTPYARCVTETPADIALWKKQQERWMKSANREAIDSFKQISKVAHPMWYTYELVYQQFFSLLLLVGMLFQFLDVVKRLVPLLIEVLFYAFAWGPVDIWIIHLPKVTQLQPDFGMALLLSFLPVASFLISVGIGGFLRGIAGFFVCIRTNERWYRLLSTVYGYYYMRYLVFLRIKALLNIYDTSWGTSHRAEREVSPPSVTTQLTSGQDNSLEP